MEDRATFAAGCFWGVESMFRQLEGVTATRVGYTGGSTESPTYREVCRGRTGHAEAVEVTFDPETVSYADLLDAFWSGHNPRSRNRQGLDIGSQYRSAIFFHGAAQEAAALATREARQAALGWGRRIATEIEPAGPFHEAEEYHQQYFEKAGHGSCTARLRAS